MFAFCMVLPMNQFSVYIITVEGTRSFDNLKLDLIKSFGIQPTIVFGLTPKNLPCAGTPTHVHDGKQRKLSCSEVAAALSHSRARELAYSQGSDWSIFLEDDSEFVENDNSNFLKNLFTLPKDEPVFVHLFPEQNGILISSQFEGMRQILKLPDYANAYCLNKIGLKSLIANSDINHLYLADWPKFPKKMLKLASRRSIFRHPHEDSSSSLIVQGRNLIQSNSMSYKLIYRVKQLSFMFIRPLFPNFGIERISSESLRTIKLW